MSVSRSLWDYREFIQGSKARVRRRQARLRVAPLRLVQRPHRVLPGRRPPGARAGHRLERAPAARRRAARASRRPRRRSTASIASTATTPRHARRAAEIARDCFDAVARAAARCWRRPCAMTPARCASRRSRRSPRRSRRRCSGSIETMTALLTDGLVARGHDVTLFATGDVARRRRRAARHLRAGLPRGRVDLAVGAVRAVQPGGRGRAGRARSTSSTARPSTTRCRSPSRACRRRRSCSTLHHSPDAPRGRALVAAYPEAPFVAVSQAQARVCCAASTSWRSSITPSTPAAFAFRAGAATTTCCSSAASPRARASLQAIDAARRVGHARSCSRPPRTTTTARSWRRSWTARTSSTSARWTDAAKAALLGGARALLYPVQAGEPFGLVLAEATACGTPVAALDRGAVREVVDDGVTGGVFESLDALVAGLPRVLALDRARVRARAVERFGVDRMVDALRRCVRRRSRGRTGRAGRRPMTRRRCATSTGTSLLAVFAHPDDESLACGGLLAWCAALGARVSLLCADARRSGVRVRRPTRTPATASGRHARRASCERGRRRVLGVSDVVLLDYADGMLPWVRRRRARGGHPRGDRARCVRTSSSRSAKTASTGTRITSPSTSGRRRRGRARRATRRRCTTSRCRPGRCARCVDAAHAAARRRRARATCSASTTRTRSARWPRPPTLVVDAGEFAARKLAAIRCHRTQLAGGPFDQLSADDEAERAARRRALQPRRRSASQAPPSSSGWPVPPRGDLPDATSPCLTCCAARSAAPA